MIWVKNTVTLLLSLLGMLFSIVIYSAEMSAQDQEILERIKPISSVCLSNQPCAKALTKKVTSNKVRTGEEVYSRYCTTCHSIGLLGAPKKGDVSEWTRRVKKSGSFAKLFKEAYPGIRSMPARGTCMDCSEKEFQNAMHYMGAPKK